MEKYDDTKGGLLTRKELAVFLNVSESTIYNHSRAKKIPMYKIGRRCYYKFAEVNEALKRVN